MASSVGRSRLPKGQVTEQVTSEKRPPSNEESSAADFEDSGIHLDEGPVFGCAIYGPEPKFISLSHFGKNRIAYSQTEVPVDRDTRIPADAMTVHASDRRNKDHPRPKETEYNSEADRNSGASHDDRICGRSERVQKLQEPGSRTISDRPSSGRRGQTPPRDDRSPSSVLVQPKKPTSGSETTDIFAGSDPDSDEESVTVSFLSAPETMPPMKPCRDTRNKIRFKKFFRPVRRSHSAGNTKEASRFSLFHRREPADVGQSESDRQSINAGRASMESASDRETAEQIKETSSTSKKDNNSKKKKSLTTEVREKLYVLRRRYTAADLGLVGSSKDISKTDKPTPEAIKNWSKTFEFLLADKFGLQCFHAFLKSEFSEENIDFWMACDDYKSIKANKMAAQAQKIFAEFIAHQAPREINIDSVTRELTRARMVNPDASTFDIAQKRIQALMDKDSYPRFIQSSLYQELISGKSPILS